MQSIEKRGRPDDAFLLAFPDSFIGGEYQTKERCEYAAVHQLQHWKITYGSQLRYRCEVRED